MAEGNWFLKFLDTVSRVVTAKQIVAFILSLGTGSALTAYVSRHMFPAGWSDIDKWFTAVAVCCFGTVATMLATQGVFRVSIPVRRGFRRRFCRPPDLVAKAYGGMTSVLEIENIGGTGYLQAMLQIVDTNGPSIKRQDPYHGLWRDDRMNALRQVVDVKLRSKRKVKLAIAGLELRKAGAFNVLVDTLCFYGNEWEVDRYAFDSFRGDSPEIVVDVSITSDPPLALPFQRRYRIYSKQQAKTVSIREVRDA